MFSTVASVVRFLVSVVFLGVVGAGSWFGWKYYSDANAEIAAHKKEIAAKTEQIQVLEADVAAKQEEIERLDLAMRLLKVDHREAQVWVVDQNGTREEGNLVTRVKFIEVDAEGNPISESKVFTLEGDVLYVDAWVVKFDDELVETGDPLRSASLCLFRRMFGEHQQPDEGQTLDNPFERPDAYGGNEGMSDLERQVWQNFWDYANDPEKAAEIGVRAAHGEAPSIQLREDKIYELTLRASGGLTIRPYDPPAVMVDE